MSADRHSKPAVYAALAGNLAVAATKFAAFWWTGSSSMLSESVHSLVDTLNEALLLYGLYRARLSPDRAHPLGHGRELYFWSFIVALLVFALGAGVSLYEGVVHLRDPEPITSPSVSFVVLGLSGLFEGASFMIGWRQFRSTHPDGSVWSAIRRSKDPVGFSVLLEDSAALAGIGIAALATLAAVRLGQPAFDGLGSVGIGLLLAATAALLARETKALLIGESASRETVDMILQIAREQPGVVSAGRVITAHLSPDEVTAAIDLRFDDTLRTPQIEAALKALEARIQAAVPETIRLFVTIPGAPAAPAGAAAPPPGATAP
jgi:cation diffusion facilitator family transporter